MPVEMNIGFFLDATFLINGICVMSADAILNAGTFSESRRSTASSSNGVEKHKICFCLA